MEKTTDTNAEPSTTPDNVRLLSGEPASEVFKVEDPTEKLGHLFLKMIISGLVGVAASMASDKALDALYRRRHQNKTTETTES